MHRGHVTAGFCGLVRLGSTTYKSLFFVTSVCMTMALSNIFEWKHTYASLKDLENLLICQQCKKIVDDPVMYDVCGHLVCKMCTQAQPTMCPVCKIPSHKLDHALNNIITGYKLLSSLITPSRYRVSTSDETQHHVENSVKDFHLVDTNVDQLDEQQQDGDFKKPKRNSERNARRKEVTKEFRSASTSRKKELNNEGICSETRKTKKPDKEVVKSSTKYNVIADVKTRSRSCPSRMKMSDKKTSEITATNSSDASPSDRNAKRVISKPNVGKDIMKRNCKGETLLHVTCIKGNQKKLEELLLAGANPSTKDNAGWTPLHEGVSKGFVDIVKLLLEAGAIVNVPGDYNNTPLHDAALNNQLEVAKLLIAYGADRKLRNIDGNTPRCLATTEEMVDILMSKPLQKERTCENIRKHLNYEELVLHGCNLDSKKQNKLSSFVNQFRLKQVTAYSADVSHIVTSTCENQCSVAVPILHAILQGKWILSSEWLDQCLNMKELVDPEKFELKGTTDFPNSGGPKRGRINANNLLPSIFNGCFFYLVTGNKFLVGEHTFSKSELTALIYSGGGSVLSREPNPEAIPPRECTVPYHADYNGTLAKCSHYIIYQPGKGEPQIKYNMTHVKTLPITWLLQCIETFSLMEP